MNDEMDGYLITSLRKLEKAMEQVVQTQGYTKEVEHMRMLKELIKEQMPNENSRSTTGQTR